MTAQYLYKVTFTNQFPFDMLRYDQCMPFTEIDAIMLNSSVRRERTIQLTSVHSPTVERWASFGATVTYERTR